MSATNYAFGFTNGTLTIGQALLTASADNKGRTYGQTKPVFTASYSGFVNGDTTSVLSGSPSLSTAATTNSPVGLYDIDVSQGTLGATNYTFVFTNGTLTIGQALLMVNADNKSRAYGAGNPTLTASYTGFVNGETLTNSGVSGNPALSTTATNSSPAGNYPIDVAQGTLNSSNYLFGFDNGTLTVVEVQPQILAVEGAGTPSVSITWSAVSNVTYRVQYESDLNSGAWSDLTPDVTATGATASATDNVAGGPARFYRIFIVP